MHGRAQFHRLGDPSLRISKRPRTPANNLRFRLRRRRLRLGVAAFAAVLTERRTRAVVQLNDFVQLKSARPG